MPRVPTNQYESDDDWYDDDPDMFIQPDDVTVNGIPRKPPREDLEWAQRFRSEQTHKRRREQ